MIKKTVLGLMALTTLLLAPLHTATATVIKYEAIDLPDVNSGEDLWQYRYQVSQFNFPQEWGFDIFFDLADSYLAGDLLEPLLPPTPDWDVLPIQPDPGLPDNGRYDAMAVVDNPSLNGCFTQTFIWHGQGPPGAQRFEVFNAFQVQALGTTTPANFTCPAVAAPEPGVFWLLGMGLLGLVWSRTKQQA